MQQPHVYWVSLIFIGFCLVVVMADAKQPSELDQPVLQVEPVATDDSDRQDTADVAKTKSPEAAISARAYSVNRLTSGEVVTAFAAEEVLPIASITKLFTAQAVLTQYQTLSTTITATDVASEGPYGKLSAGDTYDLYTLIFPLLIESSNDAGAAMERTVGGGELVQQMNEWAEVHGSTHTRFSDASGLADTNVSTAAELALLTRTIAQEQPHLFDITRLPLFVGQDKIWANNNPIFSSVGYKGGKHGYTQAAGRTLVAIAGECIYVILGTDDLVASFTTLQNTTASACAADL